MINQLLENFRINPLHYADNLISFFEQDNVNPDDILSLAYILAKSGKQIKVIDNIFADVPSTGGPSSLTTLLCPLYLSLKGYKVLKLGVPGRPAGGIDVLAQIKNYQTNFTFSNIERLIKDNDYIHFLANKDFAPLDALLFNYRKKIGKVDVPSLAIASLLSKKIAKYLLF